MRLLPPRRKTYNVKNAMTWEYTEDLMVDKMTDGNDYQGAIDSAKQLVKLGKKVYNFYAGPKIPKDPKEIIQLAKQVQEEEKLLEEAEKAKEYIKTTWKARDQKARAARRAKLKRIFHIKN